MFEIAAKAHPILAVILLLLYLYLGIQFYRKRNGNVDALELTVAQFIRIPFWLVYLTGLLMSMNARLSVENLHHYASLIPVVVLFAFQLLPSLLKKEVSIKNYAVMFFVMFFAVIVISLSARMNILFY